MPRIAMTAWLLLAFSAAHGAEYARPGLLFQPADVLASHLVDPSSRTHFERVVVLDVRPKGSPPIEGFPLLVRGVDASAWARSFGDGSDAAGWSQRISRVVPRPDMTVVVADDTLSPTAARVWWILKYWGVGDARLLNGGLSGWARYRRNQAIDFQPSFRPEHAPFQAIAHPERLASRTEVLEIASGSLRSCLVDTRSDREVAVGRVPAAGHSDWVRYVDPVTGGMRSADELAGLLREVGFEADEPAVAYCRSGGRASVVAFAMELMGGQEVANYYGSWNDWSSDLAAPVARPSKAGP